MNASDLKAFLSSTSSAPTSVAAPGVSSAVATQVQATGISQRLFGVRRGVAANGSSPTAKLSQATVAIEARIMELKQRATKAREQALAAHKSGDKTTAMRMMHRAKACEKQIDAMWNASSALERQSEMLEEASLQKQVADALSVSVKKMKGSQRLLEGVEKLSDDAAEMRDISDDVKAALESMSQSTTDPALDDDELMSELQAMVDEQPAPAAEAPLRAPANDAMPLPAFPSAPSNRGFESASDQGPSVALGL